MGIRFAGSCIPRSLMALRSCARSSGIGIVGARFIVGRFNDCTACCSFCLCLGTELGAVGERFIGGRRTLGVGSPSSCSRPVAEFASLGVAPVDLRSNGGGGSFLLLLGPILLPRPGLGPASRRPSTIELKPPIWVCVCVNAGRAGRARNDAFVKRDCRTFTTPLVSRIAGVLGEPKVGRPSFAAC